MAGAALAIACLAGATAGLAAESELDAAVSATRSTPDAAPAGGTATAGHPDASAPGDVEALIGHVQAQIERLNKAAQDRDQALNYLEQQIDAAANALNTTGETAEQMRARTAELNSRVVALTTDRDELAARLRSVADERAQHVTDLEQRIAGLEDALGGTRREATELEHKATALGQELASSQKEKETLTGALLGRDARLAELERRLVEEETGAKASAGEIARLNIMLASMADQMKQLTAALDSSQSMVGQQGTRLEELGARLNEALAQKVEELSAYRSDFFGRLRQVLGERQDVRIVGDRFVFQSELLFASGSAKLGTLGEDELRKLATTLKQVAATIPSDLDWVLRVDGHTDRQALRADAPFHSNWELSTARAIAVVEFLIREGVPPGRLAATGFGEFKPLDSGDSDLAYQRNRRIEFKLTEG